MKIGEMLRTKRVVVLPREGESEDEEDEEEDEGGGKTPVGSWNLPRGFVVVWVKVVDQVGHGSGEERTSPEPEVGSWLVSSRVEFVRSFVRVETDSRSTRLFCFFQYDLFTLTYDVPWLHPDIEDLLPPPQIVARITSDVSPPFFCSIQISIAEPFPPPHPSSNRKSTTSTPSTSEPTSPQL